MWVILPGWACPPTDYEELIADEPYVVLDQWETPLTEPLDIIRREVARLIAEEHDAPEMPTKVKLFGHSFGGLIAVEWAWKHPEEVEQLVLADPSEPEPIGDRLPPLRMTKLMVKGTAVAGPWLYRVSRKLFGTRQDQWGVRERFAGRKNAQFLVDEFFAVERKQHYLAREPLRINPEMPIAYLVSAGSAWQRYLSPGQRKFLSFQRIFAGMLGVEPVMLRGHNHLFPINHPELVRKYV